MTRIIAINGPPRSGKDTFAGLLSYALNQQSPKSTGKVSLAEPLYRSLDVRYVYDYQTLDAIKTDPTFRKLITNFAEGLIKPLFGEDWCVSKTITTINELYGNCRYVIIPDLGFEVELKLLEEYFVVDIIRIEKEGTSFDLDSRSYIGTPKYTVTNNTNLGGLMEQANSIAKDYI